MTARLKANRKKRGHVSAGHGRIGKHRKHPGGHGMAGGLTHARNNIDKYHPGYFGKVGQRHYCFRKSAHWKPVTNVENLWGLLSESAFEHYSKNKGGKVPVVDATKAGFFKVCGKGELPADMPLIVKARYFSADAEKKIKAAGGACVLVA